MRSTHLLALAIDMPFMNETYLRSLCGFAARGCGVVPRIDRRAEPLAAIFRCKRGPSNSLNLENYE
jgi:molybdopterin-guanine dinucleotide biosynthesis protein A